MKVPKRIMKDWKSIKDYGDQVKIHELSVELGTPVSEVTISKQFNAGEMNEITFAVTAEYYKRKRAVQRELLRTANDQN